MTADELSQWLKIIAAVGTVLTPLAAGAWKLASSVLNKFDEVSLRQQDAFKEHTDNILTLHREDREEHRKDREAFLEATRDMRKSQEIVVSMHEDYKQRQNGAA